MMMCFEWAISSATPSKMSSVSAFTARTLKSLPLQSMERARWKTILNICSHIQKKKKSTRCGAPHGLTSCSVSENKAFFSFQFNLFFNLFSRYKWDMEASKKAAQVQPEEAPFRLLADRPTKSRHVYNTETAISDTYVKHLSARRK